jgi:MFS transporter, FSR family, fosmidomycin resistance protein
MNTAALNPLETEVKLADDAKIIGLVGLAHSGSHFSHLILPLMFPAFIKAFGLSYSELGFMMSVFFFVSGVGQAGSGFLVDKVGARPVMFLSLLLLAAACFWCANAQSYMDLILVGALLGLGNCAFHPVDYTILNQRVSTKRIGYAYSAHGLTGNLGWALAPVFMVGITQLSNWQTAFASAGVLYILIFLVLCVYRESILTQSHTKVVVADEGEQISIFKLPVLWLCFAFFFFSTMTLAVVQNYAVIILQALYDVSLQSATMTLTSYMLCAAAGMLSGGFVAAKWPTHSDRVVATCMSVGAVLVALCASAWLSGFWAMLVLAVTGFALGIGGPSRDMMIRRATPKGATGRVYGVVYSGLDAGFAVAPTLFGYFMDHSWFAGVLLCGALTLLVSVVFAFAVGRQATTSI